MVWFLKATSFRHFFGSFRDALGRSPKRSKASKTGCLLAGNIQPRNCAWHISAIDSSVRGRCISPSDPDKRPENVNQEAVFANIKAKISKELRGILIRTGS